MAIRRWVGVVLCALTAPSLVFAGKPRPCVTADDPARLLNKDVCLAAHVYDVVQLTDGTRFLDICSPETPDDQCRFTIVSLRDDRTDVGELGTYRDKDVEIRGTVQPMRGRSGI